MEQDIRKLFIDYVELSFWKHHMVKFYFSFKNYLLMAPKPKHSTFLSVEAKPREDDK
jgi:hypothetical protein